MVKPEMPPDPPAPPETGEPQAPPYRHRFALRWQRKREARSTRHAWKILVLDLILLAVIVVLTWLLARALQ